MLFTMNSLQPLSLFLSPHLSPTQAHFVLLPALLRIEPTALCMLEMHSTPEQHLHPSGVNYFDTTYSS